MALAAVAGAAVAAGKSFLGGAAVTAAGGVAAAKHVFDYNRENFMEDREQRMKKEFQERKLRITQASLWREDVRDFVSLTERKMKYYLLVNVLLLGFNVNLWCEGRLPEHSPGWLMMGYQIATAGSFLFLLLTVWLSMHAAVAAQSYQARVLTQLVRLPVPTWAELEACRTYASEFEAIDSKQMFRVPFVGGAQEGVALRSATDLEQTFQPPADQTGPQLEAAPLPAGGGTRPPEFQSEICQSCGSTYALDSCFCRGCGQRRRWRTFSSSTDTPSECTIDGSSDVPATESPPSLLRGLSAADLAAASARLGAADKRIACDPWGLERRGDDIYELGTQHGKDVAKLRHIKIIRQAAVYWQTYDAFARVSMSVGVNQLLLAMSYYILGYVLCQVRCPAAAFAGVISLVGTAEVMARMDLTLPVRQQRLIQFLLVLGPGVSCVAAYNWGLDFDLADKIAECLAPLAFVSHAAVLGLITLFLRVREQTNGAMLPLAFQGVLYLDVFGWIHEAPAKEILENAAQAALAEVTEHKVLADFNHQKTPAEASPLHDEFVRQISSAPALKQNEEVLNAFIRQLSAAPTGTQASAGMQNEAGAQNEDVVSATTTASTATSPRVSTMSCIKADKDDDGAPTLSFYAEDYFQGEDEESISDVSDLENSPTGIKADISRDRPAVAAIAYDHNEKPIPMRPDDFMPKGTAHDMRKVRGAPRMWETVSAVDAPAKEFFEPVTFMPPEGRRRCKVDELFEKNERDSDQELEVATGHDNEAPGLLPWHIFRNSAALLCLVWVAAAAVSLWEAAEVRRNLSPWWVVPEEEELSNEENLLAHHSRDVPGPSITALWAAGLWGASVGPPLEPIAVQWPYLTMSPRGLSCDVSGKRLLVTDGLATFEADVTSVKAQNASTGPSGNLRSRSAPAAGSSGVPAVAQAVFEEATRHCAALRGEALIDTALLCNTGNHTGGEAEGCRAIVLHRHGRRVAICPLDSFDTMMQLQEHGYAISRGWLERANAGAKGEEVAWVLVDHACAEGSGHPLRGGCTSVATSRKRVVKLQQGEATPSEMQEPQPVVPVDVLDEREQPAPGAAYARAGERSPGVSRAFNARYIGVLQPQRMSIRVLDVSLGGTEAGNLLLPINKLAEGFSEPPKSLLHKKRHGNSRHHDHPIHRAGDDRPAVVQSFCAGGGYVYLLGTGANPSLWRVSIPTGLWPDALQPSSAAHDGRSIEN